MRKNTTGQIVRPVFQLPKNLSSMGAGDCCKKIKGFLKISLLTVVCKAKSIWDPTIF